jgi:hypothetical protein
MVKGYQGVAVRTQLKDRKTCDLGNAMIESLIMAIQSVRPFHLRMIWRPHSVEPNEALIPDLSSLNWRHNATIALLAVVYGVGVWKFSGIVSSQDNFAC